jgi:hypothetical protein
MMRVKMDEPSIGYLCGLVTQHGADVMKDVSQGCRPGNAYPYELREIDVNANEAERQLDARYEDMQASYMEALLDEAAASLRSRVLSTLSAYGERYRVDLYCEKICYDGP